MGIVLDFADSQRMYKLEGESLKAAQQVIIATERFLKHNPVQFTGRNMKDIGDDYNKAYGSVTQFIAKHKPEILEQLGLDKAAIRVVDTYGHFHRAYSIFPRLYMSEMDGSIYMYSPVDYKGEHFRPKDSILLSEDGTKRAGDKLFMGGWGSPYPILPRAEQAVDMPKDFNPQYATMLGNDPLLRKDGDRQYRFFMTRKNGESENIIREYKDKSKHEMNSFTVLTDHIRDQFNAIAKSNNVLDTDPSRKYYPTFMRTKDKASGKAEVIISVFHEGFSPNGQTAKFSEQGDYFDTERKNNITILVPHSRTPEARTIKELFDKMTNGPSLEDFPRIMYPEAIKPTDSVDGMFGDRRTPIIRELGNDTVLEYRVNKGKPLNFCPPDSVEVSEALYLWLKENQEDAQKGYNLPPMPPKLLKEYKLAKTLTMARSVAPRPPFPK
jgi:hypothetical protein